MIPSKMPPLRVMRSLLMYRDVVPRSMRFWLFILIAAIYQLAGGVYVASLTQIIGDTHLQSEDVTMASYCTLAGLTMVFPMLFRLKFRFFTRQLFFLTAGGLIICNSLVLNAPPSPIVWVVCFIAGALKMVGMFGVMSSVQLVITPTRNFAVFFPVVYILVCGCMQLSGLATAYLSYIGNWRLMNVMTIGLLLLVITIVYFLMKRDHRSGPYMPLKGVDFGGFCLWSLWSIIGCWIFAFGEYYDWLKSNNMRLGIILFGAMTAVCLFQSWRKKDAYIELSAFAHGAVWRISFALLGMAVLHGALHTLQPVLMGRVLHFDALNIISLNYPELIGVVAGAILSYYMLVRFKWGVKRSLFVSFLMIGLYQYSMYCLVDGTTNIEKFYLPMMLFGCGEVIMEVVATWYLSQTIPFNHFFQTITIIGFARAGVGTALGGAIAERWLTVSMARGQMVASETYDIMSGFDVSSVVESVEAQGTVLALKECYGEMCWLALCMLLVICVLKYRRKLHQLLPLLSGVRKMYRRPMSVNHSIEKK